MNKRDYLKKLSLKNPWHLLALGFGSGLAPKAPGTFGSLAAIPFCYELMSLDISYQIFFVILSFLTGIKACQKAEDAMGIHDHGGIVFDEFVGMFITVIALPATITSLVLAFVFFRLFDILKPFPISYLDRRVKGGLGIMIDDVLAGIFALISVHALYYAYSLYCAQ